MTSSSDADEVTPPWVELPREITATIFHKLGTIEILTTAQEVCTTWRSVCQDPDMWRSIDMRNKVNIWEMPYEYDLEKMCRHAVDRSEGQLIDINIENFGTDDLLLYISQRCGRLRSLQLVFCYDITDEGLVEAVKNFPLLEELHLYYTPIDATTIEIVGRSCLQLKSFKLNHRGYKIPHLVCDLDALAIAENMPELRHLQLFGNKLTDDGLQAILDGCPNLESLDLRQCFSVDFEGNLRTLCAERIKDLRFPNDRTDDYGFDAELNDYETSDDDYYISGLSDIEMVSDYDDFSGASLSSYEYEEEFFVD
ncbi:hypothetical protein RD792_003883 [Penstemon davidsonii]|uniref:F-box domain-containing protein n=1 Tax=Penstemon davidsonii TaxID=160366 RepID=A0ABR0DH29_9LAMI|nr:hypothetical protein RD792_003883 [Penstemon davidsonii]